MLFRHPSPRSIFEATMTDNHRILTQALMTHFSALPQVLALGVGGSQASGMVDDASDIDLYVFSTDIIPLAAREAVVAQCGGASRSSMNLTFWDLGDEWYDAATGIEVDVIYWHPQWIEEQVMRVVRDHQPAMGYSTCFWRTMREMNIGYDPSGWLAGFQTRVDVPYPSELRRAIIEKNHAVLRTVIPSYAGQIEKAIKRADLVSINHRVAALLASYFDVIFAVNEVLHPGEKKLIKFALENCRKLPHAMPEQIEMLLLTSANADESVLVALNALLDSLDGFLQSNYY